MNKGCAPGYRLSLSQVTSDQYLGHVEGLGCVYWIHRSPVWGGRWQAFEVLSDGSRSAIHYSNGGGGLLAISKYRNDLFDFLRHRPLSRLHTSESADAAA